MANETTKPLWRRLNEQRTHGEWNIETNVDEYPFVMGDDNNTIAMYFDPGDISLFYGRTLEETEANVKYTALAVNNMALMAEVLDGLIRAVEFDGEALPDIAQTAAIKAKAALKNIS